MWVVRTLGVDVPGAGATAVQPRGEADVRHIANCAMRVAKEWPGRRIAPTGVLNIYS